MSHKFAHILSPKLRDVVHNVQLQIVNAAGVAGRPGAGIPPTEYPVARREGRYGFPAIAPKKGDGHFGYRHHGMTPAPGLRLRSLRQRRQERRLFRRGP